MQEENLKSCGVDLESAKELGIKTVIASGLPGKYTPKTAGKILFECIKENLYDRGYEL